MWAPRVIYGMLFYALALTLVLVAKPPPAFAAAAAGTKRALPFGLGPGKTAFSLGVISTTLAITSFFVFALIDVVAS